MARSNKKKLGMIAAIAIVALAGLGGGATAWMQRQEEAALIDALDTDDANARAQAFYKARYVKNAKSVERLLKAFEVEEDRTVLSRAGYAVMTTQDPRSLALLKQRVESGPDDWVRADLIVCIARHEAADDSRNAWLHEWMASDSPWLKLGGAGGALILGDPQGGAVLIEAGRCGSPAERTFVLAQLNKVVKPMSEAIGYPLSWPDTDEVTDELFWSDLATFWDTHGKDPLLADVLERLFVFEGDWFQLTRLMHARDYAEKLVN